MLGLVSPAIVERDWYAVRALAAIAKLEPPVPRLVLAGGAALARAHRVIRRVTENIELKIVATTATVHAIREHVTFGLHEAGFRFDAIGATAQQSHDGGRHLHFRVPYTSSLAVEGRERYVDHRLVRHIYDIWAVRAHYDRAAAAALVPDIERWRARAFGEPFPMYREALTADTRLCLTALKAAHQGAFNVYLRDAVYGERVDFADAVREIEALCEHVGARRA